MSPRPGSTSPKPPTRPNPPRPIRELDHRPVRVPRSERAIKPAATKPKPAKRPAFDVLNAEPLDFADRKITWINRISGAEETDRVKEGARSIKIEDGVLTFPGAVSGVRSVRLSAITSVQ